MQIPTNTPTSNNPYKSDVLHSTEHSQLTPEEVAKALRRHQREHPSKATQPAKTAPRG